MKHKKIACLVSLFLLRGIWLSAMDSGENIYEKIKYGNVFNKNSGQPEIVAYIGNYATISFCFTLREKHYEVETDSDSIFGKLWFNYTNDLASIGGSSPLSVWCGKNNPTDYSYSVEDIVMNRLLLKRLSSDELQQQLENKDFPILKKIFHRWDK